MPRREYRLTFHCAGDGCGESVTRVCDTRAEEADANRRNRERPWKCDRHADPARNLRPGNERARQVLIATRIPVAARPGEPEWWLPGLYWCTADGGHGRGVVRGPGFNAHAADFPEGTRLVVTARIEMPDDN
jgi:hypothetical protein